MDSLIPAIAVFLSPYLHKAGEKVAEKTVETLFDLRADLADKFTGFFKPEIISLGLSDHTSSEEVTKRLNAQPEVKGAVDKKIADNQDMLNELVNAFQQLPQQEFRGISINAKNIGSVINNPTGPISMNNTFS